jgi:hypothetical protein
MEVTAMVLQAVFLLLVMGIVNHQITYILTTSVLFAGFRQRVISWFGPGSKVSYLVTCHLCASTWVAFLMAAAINSSWNLTSVLFAFTGNSFIDWGLLAFATGFIGRLANEILALLSQTVYRREWEQERNEILAQRADIANAAWQQQFSGAFDLGHGEHIHGDLDDLVDIEFPPFAVHEVEPSPNHNQESQHAA